jgi:hypothetical protein
MITVSRPLNATPKLTWFFKGFMRYKDRLRKGLLSEETQCRDWRSLEEALKVAAGRLRHRKLYPQISPIAQIWNQRRSTTNVSACLTQRNSQTNLSRSQSNSLSAESN